MKKNEPRGFESGWENLDHHPDLTQRPRPMFDAKGNPVETAPEPEPLTAAEEAMFAAVEAGVDPAAAVATGVIVGQDEEKRAKIVELARGGVIKSGTVVDLDLMIPMAEMAKAAKIRELATTALDSPSPAAWAVALAEILRELDA